MWELCNVLRELKVKGESEIRGRELPTIMTVASVLATLEYEYWMVLTGQITLKLVRS